MMHQHMQGRSREYSQQVAPDHVTSIGVSFHFCRCFLAHLLSPFSETHHRDWRGKSSDCMHAWMAGELQSLLVPPD